MHDCMGLHIEKACNRDKRYMLERRGGIGEALLNCVSYCVTTCALYEYTVLCSCSDIHAVLSDIFITLYGLVFVYLDTIVSSYLYDLLVIA